VTWFYVDDSFHSHPKLWDAPDCAIALWVRAGSWCAHYLTDGFVPERMVPYWTRNPEEAVKELVARGIWEAAEGGYQFHDWEDWNPSRENVLARRQYEAERKRRYRERTKRPSGTDGGTYIGDSRVSSRTESLGPIQESPNGDSRARARVPGGTPARGGPPTGVDRETAQAAAAKHVAEIRKLLAEKRGKNEP
jgi:hypothetical protein